MLEFALGFIGAILVVMLVVLFVGLLFGDFNIISNARSAFKYTKKLAIAIWNMEVKNR